MGQWEYFYFDVAATQAGRSSAMITLQSHTPRAHAVVLASRGSPPSKMLPRT